MCLITVSYKINNYESLLKLTMSWVGRKDQIPSTFQSVSHVNIWFKANLLDISTDEICKCNYRLIALNVRSRSESL